MLVIGCVGAAFWCCVLFGISIDVCSWKGAAKGEVCLLVAEESTQRGGDYDGPRNYAVGK